MQSVDAITLKNMMSRKEDFLLIDVREPHEHAAFNIGGELVPLAEIAAYKIPAGKKTVLYCQKGIRSVIAIQRLQSKLPDAELLNLSGGMEEWIRQFGTGDHK